MNIETRISSRRTYVYKTAAPFILIAFCVFPSSFAFLDGTIEPNIAVIVGLLTAYSVIGYLGWLTTRSLADEVGDGGSYLLVRRGAITACIAIADIVNVQSSQWVARIPRITLHLANPGALGSSISFLPIASGLIFSAENPLAESLAWRAYEANGRRGA